MPRAKTGRKRLAMTDDMTIYNAAVHKEKLLQAIADCQALAVDLTKVGEIDTAGIQVLILANREAARLGKVMQLSAVSEAVSKMLALFNLNSHFGIQSAQ